MLIGHGHIMEFLRRSKERERLAHAYLFVGPEHVGKMTVARAFASELLGTETLENHPDYFLVERGHDAKTGKLHAAIVLDQVHGLCSRLSMGAFMNGWKVCILDGAHLLNTESANALLKNLEEPFSKTLFILLATSLDRVQATIRSRCQVTHFGRVPTVAIAEALAGQDITRDRSELYARLSHGCPGTALRFADDPGSLEAMRQTREVLLRFPELGIADRFAAIDKLIPPKLAFQETLERVRAILDLATELLRDAMLHEHAGASAVHADVQERLIGWRRAKPAFSPQTALEEIAAARRLLDRNVNPRAVLEHAALSF